MPRVRLLVAYDGTDFHGWQSQEPPGAPPLRTVQGVLREAIERTLRREIVLVGASRTDAGVHAVGQVAAFSADFSMPVEKIPLALTSRLPPDLQVREAAVVPESFDPIAGAVSKAYRYRIASADPPRRWPPLFDRRLCWWARGPVELAAMQDAAARLVGEHDLAGLAQAHHGRTSTIRSIHACSVAEDPPGRFRIDIAGSGFLYHTVRIVAGTLLEIGRGRMPPARIDEILARRDRRLAGPTLGPEGLCLRWVRYEGDPPPQDAADLPG